MPFLYQETSFIELEALQRVKDGDKKEDDEVKEEEPKVPKTRSGIKIILSRVPFEVENHVGYQKPKPRTFMTQPRQKVVEVPIVEEKKPKRSAPKEKSEKIKVEKESLKKEVPEFKTDRGYKKKVATTKRKPDSRERPGTSRNEWSRNEDKYWAEFDPYHRRPVDYREDDDYMRGPIRGHRGNSERRPFRGSGRGYSRDYPDDYYMRMPPRYARRPPTGEGGPERPGFYAGNRPFKMDRSRYPPLEDERTFKKPSRDVKK